MWSLPPEFLAFHYYEREGGWRGGGGGGGGAQHVSVLLIKVEEDRIVSVPHPLSFSCAV